jgi:hypothetical protein
MAPKGRCFPGNSGALTVAWCPRHCRAFASSSSKEPGRGPVLVEKYTPHCQLAIGLTVNAKRQRNATYKGATIS